MNCAHVAVFHAPGQPLELREVELPQLAPGEVLVRVRLTTLCGSDLHTFAGSRSTPTPTILGHEIIGDVIAIGEGAEKRDLAGRMIRPGDRVTWSIAAHCGDCFYCTHGLPQKCEALFKYGHERLTDERPLSGGLADHCLLTRSTPVLILPETLPDEVACLANCATATAAGAVRVGELGAGDNVVVFGAGMLGLTMAAIARSRGAAEVIVVDVAPQRLRQALRFGATACLEFSSDAPAIVEVVRARTAERGADLVLEASGSPEAMEAALKVARIGGRIVFVGAVRPTRPIPLDAEQLVRRVLTLRGLHNYTPDDLAAAVTFLNGAPEYPFAEFVSRPFPLAEAEAAFAAAQHGPALRTAVRP
ncbi:MAG: alcohol dehydrogenase [Pirellula sp.]|nr:alcohol dehydrogenase [Pirellula sp.]